MAEAAVVRAVGRVLDKRGAWSFNVWGGGMMRAGLPDIVACHRGRLIAIECKSATGRLRPRQKWELRLAAAAGAVVVVARSGDDVAAALDRIEEEHERIVACTGQRTGHVCPEEETP
jgi:Holliday junction resolvase